MMDLDPKTREELAKLEVEIAELTAQRESTGQKTRELLEREAAGEKGLAGQIHQLKQDKMVLTTQMHHLRVCVNRLKLG